MPDFGKIFLGATQPDHRRFIAAALAHLRETGFEHVLIPCCGQFTLVKAAIRAGFPKENIVASDISLFSSLLGYFYAGRPLAELPLTIRPGRLKDEYDSCATDRERLALLMVYTKLAQFRTDRLFEKRYADALAADAAPQAAAMSQALDTFREFYTGITYRIEDLREAIKYGDEPKRVMVFNPPGYAKGYTKMFAGIMALVDFRVEVTEWGGKKEYRTFYDALKSLPATSFIYRIADVDGFDATDVVFANERGPRRIDYWLCTHPEALEGWSHNRAMKLQPAKPAKPYRHTRIFSCAYPHPDPCPDHRCLTEDCPFGDRLTPESAVRFVVIPQEHALWYRDCFAHRLGDVVAEIYALCLVDEKVFAVTGFHGQKLRTGQEEYIFETFGFGVTHQGYYNTTRLLMYLITTKTFARFLHYRMSHKNRTYVMKGLKTTCLSKYRKVKLNNGILPVTFREKITKGANADMYRIVYQVDWYDRTYAECIRTYLDEQAKRGGGNDNE
jgi:hypothetical protein